MTTPSSSAGGSRSLEAFFTGVDLNSMPRWSTADDLAALSVAAFAAQQALPAPAASRALVRLHGPAVQEHSVPVRKTMRVLGALQDALSAVAAALRNEPAGLRGRLPDFARMATELRLVAEPVPGSVVLKLEAGDLPSVRDTGQPPMFPVPTLADQSMHRMLELVRRADASVLDRDQLLEELRPLGPRVARQLVKLAEAVLEDDLLVDLTWQEPGREPDRAAVERSTALAIKDTITQARVDVDEVTLVGVLQTVSQVRVLDLLLESGERITLEANEEARAKLGPMYGHRVEVVAEVTIRTSGTGQDKARYQLIDVRSLEADD